MAALIAGVLWRAGRLIRECRRGALPRVRSSPSQEMSYRSHWTISEPKDTQKALGRVSRGNAKATKRVSHAYAAAATLTNAKPTQNDPHNLRRLRRPTGPQRAAMC